MALRKIGEGVTDSNGRCIIPYTGTGAGLLQLKGQCADGDSIIQSGTCEVLDTIFYDDGTSSESIWHKSRPSESSISIDTDGILLECTNASSYAWFIPKINNSNILLSADTDYCIEFDAKVTNTTSNYCIFGIIGKNGFLSDLFSSTGTFAHVKITIINREIKYYVDNVHKTKSNGIIVNETGDCGFGIKDGGITMNNFKVYPI